MADPAGHILVVGASSGIGRAVAERFAGQGSVTALARRADRLADLAGAGIATVAADVTDLAAIGGVLQSAVAERGLLTGLVYCAGVQVIKPMRSLGVDEVERLYKTNLVATTLFAAAFGNARISTWDAVFCAVSSVAAQRPEPAIVPYAASKAGLDALIRGLAREIAPRRAVGIAPGWLDTEMTQAHARAEIIAWLDRHALLCPPLVSPQAIVSQGVVLGAGAFVAHGVTVNVDACLGRFRVVNTSAIIGHNAEIGDNTTISPVAFIGGRCWSARTVWLGRSRRCCRASSSARAQRSAWAAPCCARCPMTSRSGRNPIIPSPRTGAETIGCVGHKTRGPTNGETSLDRRAHERMYQAPPLKR